MKFTDAIKICFAKYATFKGRARRAEYWWWVLFVFIGSFVIGLIPLVNVVFTFGVIVPGFAVTARRLHDVGHSGWWQVVPATLLATAITMSAINADILAAASGIAAAALVVALIIWTAIPGQSGANIYGPDPLDGGPRGGSTPPGTTPRSEADADLAPTSIPTVQRD